MIPAGRRALALMGLVALTACTIGDGGGTTAAEESSLATTVPGSPTTSPSDEPDEPDEEPPDEDRTASELRDAIDAFTSVARGSRAYYFDRWVEVGTPGVHVATSVSGIVKLDAGQAELTLSFEITDGEAERELLAEHGVETLVQLNAEVIVHGADVYLSFPNNAGWNGVWIRRDAETIRTMLRDIGYDVDASMDTGGSTGWLEQLLAITDLEARGQDGDWLEIPVPAEIASPFVPASIRDELEGAGAPTLGEVIFGYATVDPAVEPTWIRTTVWVDPLLLEAAELVPSVPAPEPSRETYITTTIWGIDNFTGVLVPSEASIVEEPPPLG